MNFLIKLAAKAEKISGNIKRAMLRKDPQFREVERWYAEDKHSLKRSEFPFLTDQSVVFDLGGYEGQWSSDIAARYNCRICIFEPVSEFANLIQHRFRSNSRIQVFTYGLADKTQESTIVIDKFSSSISNDRLQNKPSEAIQLKSFASFMEEQRISQIDLVKINIEGAEYALLRELVDSGVIHSIKALLIQFHDFVPDAAEKRSQLQQQFSQTHNKIFDYAFVWEYWLRK